jgi:hypothetical protein
MEAIYLIAVLESFDSESACSQRLPEYMEHAVEAGEGDIRFSCANGSLAPTEVIRPLARSWDKGGHDD